MGRSRQINCRASDEIQTLINERANLLQETEGGYLTLIAQRWYAEGAPPVSPDDVPQHLDKRAVRAKRPR